MSLLKDRYDKTYKYKGIEFYLSDYSPNTEECRLVILKVIEQTSRDYLSLYNSKTSALQYTWETARDFIFSDRYYINWGNQIVSPTHLLQLVDIDIEWLRRKMRERFSQIERKNNG